MLGAVVVASYVPAPGSGQRLDVGCSPCATAAVASLLLAVMARATDPTAPVMAGVALGVTAAGARQRLAVAPTCSTSAMDAS